MVMLYYRLERRRDMIINVLLELSSVLFCFDSFHTAIEDRCIMPSLRQRMTTYLRQLSFINEPRDDAPRIIAHPIHPTEISGGNGCFVTRYLDGRMTARPPEPDTQIHHGKEPADLPDIQLLLSQEPLQVISAACTGPDDGLASIRRSRLHLSAGPEIDFIDTIDQEHDDEPSIRRSAPRLNANHRPSSIAVADPNANPIRGSVETRCSVSEMHHKGGDYQAASKTKNVTINFVVNTISHPGNVSQVDLDRNRGALNVTAKPNDNEPCENSELQGRHSASVDGLAGSVNWKLENDHAYGLSVSLYEKSCVNDERAGDPIADCFGLLVRGHSAAMAMADGVNWGEYSLIVSFFCLN